MYSELENRAAQLRMINSAIRATLHGKHFDVVSLLVDTEMRGAMKYRDKLAHWCWGHSDELPDSLLIREPSYQLASFAKSVKQQGQKQPTEVPLNHDTVFVIREPDLDGFIKRIGRLSDLLQLAMGTFWKANDDKERAEHLQQLSNAPEFRSALARLAESRRNDPTTQQPSQPPDQSDGS